jgi:hypothetical protein
VPGAKGRVGIGTTGPRDNGRLTTDGRGRMAEDGCRRRRVVVRWIGDNRMAHAVPDTGRE